MTRFDVPSQEGLAEIEVGQVISWNPEHPWLYFLILQSREGEWQLHVGFRNLCQREREIFWNGKAIKLYGICYRERMGDIEGTRKDLLQLKAAGVNFLRSIYGAFSEELLSLADSLGFFVEDTAAFVGIGTGQPPMQDDPEKREWFLHKTDHLLEGINHVSVLLWSLGQDCAWGSNFLASRERIRRMDSLRPITFHLPMSIPECDPLPDVWSCTYVDAKQDLSDQYDQMMVFHTPGAHNEIGYMTAQAHADIPVLHEIWAPVPTHNRDEIRRDPAISEYWERSVARFADLAFRTPGCLGGAVLAGVDEDGSLPELEDYAWGVLTQTHEKKTEYFSLKHAYSPVRIMVDDKAGLLRLENRYLFTALSDYTLFLNGKEYAILDAEPGQTQTLAIPAGGDLDIEIRNPEGAVLSYFYERRTMPPTMINSPKGNAIHLTQSEEEILVDAGRFSWTFSKTTCLLESVCVDGEQVIREGPFLDCDGMRKGAWNGESIRAAEHNGTIQVRICGGYTKTLDLDYLLTLSPTGKMKTETIIRKIYRHMPHIVKAGIGLTSGGLSEKGISFLLPGQTRNHYFRKWVKEDMLPEGAVRHEVMRAGFVSPKGAALEILSNGKVSTKVSQAPAIYDDTAFTFEGTWYRMKDYCGDHGDTETMASKRGCGAFLHFTGTGIRLFGPLDVNYGKARIRIDGEHEAIVEETLPKVDREGESRGYEKRYGILLYAVDNLPDTDHQLEIEVLGEARESAQNTYFSIDYVEITDPQRPAQEELALLVDYNYPRLVRGCWKRRRVIMVEGERFDVTLHIGRKTNACD